MSALLESGFNSRSLSLSETCKKNEYCSLDCCKTVLAMGTFCCKLSHNMRKTLHYATIELEWARSATQIVVKVSVKACTFLVHIASQSV